MKTTQDVVAVEATIAQQEWTAAFGDVMAQVAGCFPRRDSRLPAREAVQAMLMELERRNCWALAEALGHGGPHRLQHFLSRGVWDHDLARDRRAVWAAGELTEGEAALVVDETGDAKSSTNCVGAAHQYSGALGGVGLCLVAAGQWSFLLTALPVELLGRLRSDRVMRRPTPQRIYEPKGGRPPKHGGEFVFGQPDTWGEPDVRTVTETERYGTAVATAFDRLHPRLTCRAARLTHRDELPIIEGTMIRLKIDRLPNGADPKPVWLWWSETGANETDVDRLWHAFLRGFDLEHTFRMIKQTLGWTRPKLRDPQAADRWTWLIIAAHTQLRPVRGPVTDLRRPWERPAPPNKLTPARVRRGFRNLRMKCPLPARLPKPAKPGPGRPPGAKNRRRPLCQPRVRRPVLRG